MNRGIDHAQDTSPRVQRSTTWIGLRHACLRGYWRSTSHASHENTHRSRQGAAAFSTRVVLVAVAASLFSIQAAHAQRKGISVASAQFLHAGEMTLQHVDTGEALSLRNYILSVHAMYGHRFKSTATALAAEARYDVMWGTSRLGTAPWRDETYHFPALRISMLQDFTEPWGMVAYALGGVASDMAGIGSDDLRLTIGIGASYACGPDLKIIAGAMYTNMFDLPVPLLPILDIRYRTGPATLRLSFPNSASAWLSVAPWMDLGVVIRAPNLRFTLHDRNRIADEYGVLTVTLGPVARVFAWRGLYLQGEGGYAVRNYKLHEQERISYERLDFRGWFVSASLGYMI